MILFLPDTNCILAYLRKNKLAQYIDQRYNPLSSTNTPVLSAVIVGELYSISTQSDWGLTRKNELTEFLKLFNIIDINYTTVLQRYAEIDAFSQNRLKDRPLGVSARNMGKNDLWIAATASVLEANLITTDKDFDHLHQQFVEVIWLDPNLHK